MPRWSHTGDILSIRWTSCFLVDFMLFDGKFLNTCRLGYSTILGVRSAITAMSNFPFCPFPYVVLFELSCSFKLSVVVLPLFVILFVGIVATALPDHFPKTKLRYYAQQSHDNRHS